MTPAPLSPQITAVCEQLKTDNQVHEIPSPEDSSSIIVSHALLSRIKYLQCENAHLTKKINAVAFNIQHDDKLVLFYTGFVSFAVFTTFYGPVVDHLNYWGEKEVMHQRMRKRKLDPKNQFFLTLIKLRLNPKLTYQFGLSPAQAHGIL